MVIAVPESKEPGIEHLGHPTDVSGTLLDEKRGSLRRVPILALGSITIAVQETERDERIEEVVSASRMDSERDSKLLRGHRTVAECREEIEFDCGEQDLRGPEARRRLHDVRRIELIH